MSAAESALEESRLEALVARFPLLRVAVLGDFFLDKYLEVDPGLAETSLETGKTAHQVVAVRHSPGAAGTVVNNLAALGARGLSAVGFTGDDGEGHELRRDLAALGCGVEGLHVDPARLTPTYLKPRYIDRPGLAGEHSRYDTKNRDATPARMEEAIIASIEALLPELDALIVMDQVEEEGRGVLTAGVVSALAGMLPRPGLVAWADSRRRILGFRGLALKMNQFEFAGIAEPEPGSFVSDEVVRAEFPGLARRVGAPLFVTMAERGVWVGDAASPGPLRVPAVAVEGSVDPTGAGDSFTAGAVLALAAGATLREAALVGNLVASVTVRRLGTTGTASSDDLFPALRLWKEQNP
ncbi:MAG TPA: PfkB family carbohydrate kinase [Rectinemataceae bacterium]|nr:PfkB family carbohydrate kinase [Rectinemataceae bacterium]